MQLGVLQKERKQEYSSTRLFFVQEIEGSCIAWLSYCETLLYIHDLPNSSFHVKLIPARTEFPRYNRWRSVLKEV